MCLLARRPKNPGGIDGELAKLFGNHADSLEGLERYDFLKSLEKVSLNQLESFFNF